MRKPLAGEFHANGKKLFLIANHWKSKGGDDPLFGRFQPPKRVTDAQRAAEAHVINDFVDQILAIDRNANVIVLGDLNDFEFSDALTILEGGGELHTLIETLPQSERYSFVFEGNSQTLDQILVSGNLFSGSSPAYDSVHVNAEFADQASDHDPQVARLHLTGRPKPK
ncbi:MAG TPA: endonuclease/exonuclease/phosphatase family protein [Actinomycetota bacterium]